MLGQVIGRTDTVILGRVGYESWAVDFANSDDPFAGFINSVPKHVASRTLKGPLKWQNSTLIKGDVVSYVRDLKQGSGPEVQVHGSGDLIQTLLRNDLIDEFGLWIFPVVIGLLPLALALEIYLLIDNILDNKDYHVIADMPMPGRIVAAGATLEF